MYTNSKISREKAKQLGLIKYFTGKPCGYGHVAERYCSSCSCVVCAHERQQTKKYKENAIEWRIKHKEEKRNYDKNFRGARNRSGEIQNKEVKKKYRNSPKGRASASKNFAKRRAAKLLRTPAWADSEKIKAYYDVCSFFNEVNGYIKYHVDHDYPLQAKFVSGLHVHNNLRILLAKDNVSKKNNWVPQ